MKPQICVLGRRKNPIKATEGEKLGALAATASRSSAVLPVRAGLLAAASVTVSVQHLSSGESLKELGLEKGRLQGGLGAAFPPKGTCRKAGKRLLTRP